jgi:hypothetical protein
MANDMLQVEVWVMVDEGGDYAVGVDETTACDSYDQDIGGGTDVAKRMVKVVLSIPKPATITLTGTVPAQPSNGTLSVS